MNKKFTFIDLFVGCGGLVGMDIVGNAMIVKANLLK